MVKSWAECIRLETENTRLKAEVERLQDFNDGLMAMRLQDEKGNLLTASDYARLKAEVERLNKAGDAMASGLQGMAGERVKALADEWNEANGVQS